MPYWKDLRSFLYLSKPSFILLHGLLVRAHLKYGMPAYTPNFGAVVNCSKQEYPWITCAISSDFCLFSQLVLSYHRLLSYQTFVILSDLCHLLTLCYLLTFYLCNLEMYLLYTPYTSLSHLIVRPYCALIHLLNSIVDFGHRVILMWGCSRHGWGSLLEQTNLFTTH